MAKSLRVFIHAVGGCEVTAQKGGIIAEEVRKALKQSENPGDVKLILALRVVVSGHCCGVFAPH